MCTEQINKRVVSACSFMALPHKHGKLVDMNPLGLYLHFPHRQCYAATCVSTSSPGCMEKLSQRECLSYSWPRNRRLEAGWCFTTAGWLHRKERSQQLKSKRRRRRKKKKANKKNISTFLSTHSFNMPLFDICISCLCSRSSVLINLCWLKQDT